MWKDLSMKEKAAFMKVAINNGITDLGSIREKYNSYAEGGHKVQKGDSLWKIAHDNGITLDDLLEYNSNLNNNINTVIHPGDIIRTAPKSKSYHYEYEDLNDIEAREKEYNKSNLSAIQSIGHKGNYMVVDKKEGNVHVFSPKNEELYRAPINTGLSKDDYNTLTVLDKNGSLIDMVGNNSTPAGILAISGKGIYHGAPSFTRSRIDSEGNIKKVKDAKGNLVNDDVASSMHFGIIKKGKGSNGCVRIGGKDLCNIDPLVKKGTKVYTLPEKEGSRFEVREGKLNFFADNPYGDDNNITNLPNMPEYLERYTDKTRTKTYNMSTEKLKKLGNDYNTHVDNSYSPLVIYDKRKTDDFEYSGNVLAFSNALTGGKKRLQEMFNLDSYTYDKLAQLAMGIAEQESKFGVSKRYKIKQSLSDDVVDLSKDLREDYKDKKDMSFSIPVRIASKLLGAPNTHSRSRGITQIKLSGDNDELKKIYDELNINKDNINDASKSGLATIARLAYMYNNEVRGRNFTGLRGKKISPLDALLYKWNGHNEQLRNHTATPEVNEYIRNVNKYLNNFTYESGKLVED